MHLPSAKHVRGLRATVGALHRTLHSLALAECEAVEQQQFDGSPVEGEEWVTAPQQLRRADGMTETWFGGAARCADQSASGEAALVAEHSHAAAGEYI